MPPHLRAMQAPIKERYKGDPKAAFITLEGQGHARRRQHRLQGRDRPRARGRGPASGDRRLRARTVLRRHAARGAGRLRRRHAQGGGDRARHSAQVRHGVGGGRSRFPRHARRRQGRAGRLCANPPALRRRHRRAAGQARPAAQAHRALLRRLPDHQERPAGRGEATTRRDCADTAGFQPRRRRPRSSDRGHRMPSCRTGGLPASTPGDDKDHAYVRWMCPSGTRSRSRWR